MEGPCFAIMMICGTLLIIILGQLAVAIRNNRRLEANMADLDQLLHDEQDKRNPVEESDDLLKFTQTFLGQYAVLKFTEFRDSHDMTKITRANVQDLVSAIANGVEEALNFQNINFDRLLFTREYYDQYIIDLAVDTVKRLTQKEVDQIAGQVSE